jgi:hypothetical protein
MGFIEFLNNIVSQTPRVLMGILIFCLIAIEMPVSTLKEMGLLSIRDEYLIWLWVLLFLSLSMLISHSIFKYSSTIKDLYLGWITKRRRMGVFRILTNEEKNILKDYVDNDVLTKSFSMFSGKHKRLENYGVIYASSEISVPGRGTFDFNISQWAKDYLRKHPELLGPNA